MVISFKHLNGLYFSQVDSSKIQIQYKDNWIPITENINIMLCNQSTAGHWWELVNQINIEMLKCNKLTMASWHKLRKRNCHSCYPDTFIQCTWLGDTLMQILIHRNIWQSQCIMAWHNYQIKGQFIGHCVDCVLWILSENYSGLYPLVFSQLDYPVTIIR